VSDRRRLLETLSALALAAIFGLGSDPTTAETPVKGTTANSVGQARRARLAAVRTWGYQLRITSLEPLATSDTDLVVVDQGYAARHDGKLLFDNSEVATLRRRPDGKSRIVLAYLSIGEAEQYRGYWQAAWCKRATAPAWLGAVNPHWPGNYPVRFWNADWQRLILDPAKGSLAQLKSLGFDGVFLDRADVYSEWAEENRHAEADMIAFLNRIATVARANDPNFLVVMQNAEELLTHAPVRKLLDGVAKEDLLNGIDFKEDSNPPEEIKASLEFLRQATADGIPVLAVEYLSKSDKIDASRQRLVALGFVPTFAPRLLDELPEVLRGRPNPSGQPMPLVAPPARDPSLSPVPEWAEGGPTCLVD
jgi:cysteinyl-tRNA synthetase, unknown class